MRLDAIVIGDRVRKDMGDLRGLAESITRHGLLHPVVVKKDGTLVAGHRRIEAARLLGLDDLPATVIDVDDLLSAERDENAERKDFTPTEAVAIGAIIEDQHRVKVEAVKSDMGRQNAAKRKVHPTRMGIKEHIPPLGKAREAASRAVGMSPSTYERAKAVVTAAEEQPEKFGDLPARMDETGKVLAAHREMQHRKNGTAERSIVHRKAHHPKANQEMQRGLSALDGLCSGFALIDVAKLDPAQAVAWADQLTEAASSLRSLAKKVRALSENA